MNTSKSHQILDADCPAGGCQEAQLPLRVPARPGIFWFLGQALQLLLVLSSWYFLLGGQP